MTFQPTLPARGATACWATAPSRSRNFNPRSPHGERHNNRAFRDGVRDFNPRSPHGERQWYLKLTDGREADFNPRSPHGERPNQDGHTPGKDRFQPTLPARGATKRSECRTWITPAISTHAPRTGSDSIIDYQSAGFTDFNPRSPHGERQRRSERFQLVRISTHAPRTGSDCFARCLVVLIVNFNPRSPHGERLDKRLAIKGRIRFQPTLPARGATKNAAQTGKELMISTHAPRTGSD